MPTVSPNVFNLSDIFLLDFDPRIVDTPISIFEDATDESLVFLLLMLLYYKVSLQTSITFFFTPPLLIFLGVATVYRLGLETYQILFQPECILYFWFSTQLNA